MLRRVIHRFARNRWADPLWLLCVGCLLLWLLLLYANEVWNEVRSSTAKETNVHGGESMIIPKMHANALVDGVTKRIPSLAVLIQQSPVDQPHEMNRLQAIDRGYAKWSSFSPSSPSSSSRMASTSVFAALSQEFVEKQGPFQRIQPLFIPKAPNAQQYSPMYRLVSAFYSLATLHQGVYEFTLLCNTHTFVVIPNLEDFVSKYDADELFYSGNELAIHYKSPEQLTFASGGAGIVLSHVSISLMLLTWSIIQLPDLEIFLRTDSLQRHQCKIFDSSSNEKKSTITINIYNKKSNFYMSMKCVMLYLSDIKMNKNGVNLRTIPSMSSISVVQKLQIELSSKLNMELIKKESYEYPFEVFLVAKRNEREQQTVNSEGRVLIPISKLSQCDATSKWEKDNPAIVFAHCLRIVYSVPFTDSTTDATPSSGLERFNVYGTVRSLTSNFDQWYPDGKSNVEKYYRLQTRTPHSIHKTTPTSQNYHTPNIATNPISFHYVSEMESSLLYLLLNSKNALDKESQSHPRLLNTSYVKKIWPKTDQELGHYSYKIKSNAEADLVTNYMNHVEVYFRR